MICRLCNGLIEPERLEIVPNTVACSVCANKHNLGAARKGRMIFDNKTGGTLQIMSEEVFNNTRRYYEPDGARSVMKNFSKNLVD